MTYTVHAQAYTHTGLTVIWISSCYTTGEYYLGFQPKKKEDNNNSNIIEITLLFPMFLEE